jgi:hypothetical protein
MSYAALLRPVLDRVYVGLRAASADRVRAVYRRFGLRPGFERDFYFGLLARPMPAAGFAAVISYHGGDMTGELAQGTAEVDAEGTWRLTGLGRELAAALQLAIGEGAEDLWARRPIETMPGPAAVPRLAELDGASPALRLTTRLGALRHHRADAHRAAWVAAGLTAAQIRELAGGPLRRSIEDETNRLDEPLYACLSAPERLELLAGLGALPGT